jgi:hypothetical protein
LLPRIELRAIGASGDGAPGQTTRSAKAS